MNWYTYFPSWQKITILLDKIDYFLTSAKVVKLISYLENMTKVCLILRILYVESKITTLLYDYETPVVESEDQLPCTGSACSAQ